MWHQKLLALAIGLLLNAGCTGTHTALRAKSPSEHTVAPPATVQPEDPNRSITTYPKPLDESVIEQATSWQETTVDRSPDPHHGLTADEAGTVTLESLEQFAMSTNPTLTQLQAHVDAANGRWLQVGLYPNPEIAYSAPEIGNSGTPGQQGAYFQQEFVTADKLGLNRKAAEWDIERAKQELATQQLRVLTDVRRGFYAVRVAQERVKIAEELQTISQTAVQKAKDLVKLQEPVTVLNQAEIEAELATILVENSRTQREAQWRSLAAVIGRPGLPLQEVAGELDIDAPQVAWEQTLDRIERESPELAVASARLEQTRWALQRASVQAVPNVTVQAGAMYDYGTRDPIATVQISLPIPIFNRNQGGIVEAHANVLAAQQAVQRVELSLQQRFAVVYQQYEQARQQATRYDETILNKAKRNLELNLQSYEAGQSAYLPVLTAQRSYSQARLAWLNALEQLWFATVQIEGLLLDGSLEGSASNQS